jgi:transposase InsO family protein
LSDNGSSYIAGDLAKWLDARNIKHLRGAPYHPMTQGKIERWHEITVSVDPIARKATARVRARAAEYEAANTAGGAKDPANAPGLDVRF